ncbi:MAG: hypothetical protein ACK43M_17805 [Allorhizobium sp.]
MYDSSLKRVGKINSHRFFVWLPLFMLQVYLTFTFVLFTSGPIKWPLENRTEVSILVFFYQAMIILGYWFAVSRLKFYHAGWRGFDFADALMRKYWLLLVLTFVALLIAHRNIAMTPSYLPTTLFSDFYRGLTNPLDAYLYKLSDQAKTNFSGQPLATALYGILIVCKVLLIAVLIEKWHQISSAKRVSGLFVSLFPIITAVSVGTNKPIFDLLFFYISIFFVSIICLPDDRIYKFIMARKTIVSVILFLLAFAPFYFQYTMSQRAPSLNPSGYVASEAPIKLSETFEEWCDSDEVYVAKACSITSVTTNYLTQGYYGMSVSVDKPFETTYGVGSSVFLLEAFNKYLGIDLKPRTFQRKASSQWSESQWHTVYTQVANDVGFVGVGLVMMVLGFISAAVWISATIYRNLTARCIVPLFVIMYLFIPANNQIFNMLETLCMFVILMAFWIAGFASRVAAGPRTASPG